ncbi:MAG: aldolase/citrate lyase family protein, partial [candidate division KSB1 bacterium]|nr:aldolase/citrate lyase family protein [candidate division KSB1 bacterium]
MNLSAEAGRKGPDIRSDCWIKITLTNSGGIQFEKESKVNALYGAAIDELIVTGLTFFEIEHAQIELIDSGALPFVIMARLETAVRRLKKDRGKQWLPELKEFCRYETTRDRFRRSRLYLPGNEPKFMINAGLHKPDGIILDLEDSVAPGEKD